MRRCHNGVPYDPLQHDAPYLLYYLQQGCELDECRDFRRLKALVEVSERCDSSIRVTTRATPEHGTGKRTPAAREVAVGNSCVPAVARRFFLPP